MDSENIRRRVRATYQQGSEAVVEFVVALMSELTAQVETVAARIAAVEGENAALRATLGTNSHNSGKPPSSDGPGLTPHPKSQWVVSGRYWGTQGTGLLTMACRGVGCVRYFPLRNVSGLLASSRAANSSQARIRSGGRGSRGGIAGVRRDGVS